jgi:hypothetical protein
MNAEDQTELPVSTDPRSQQPIATRWRRTLREIIKRLADGDYALQGISSVDPLSPASANQIRAYLAEYGETLVEIPEETWTTSASQWAGTHWDVLVDLWTAESGKSDLVLSVRVVEVDTNFRFQVDSVHVP